MKGFVLFGTFTNVDNGTKLYLVWSTFLYVFVHSIVTLKEKVTCKFLCLP